MQISTKVMNIMYKFKMWPRFWNQLGRTTFLHCWNTGKEGKTVVIRKPVAIKQLNKELLGEKMMEFLNLATKATMGVHNFF